MSYYICNTCGTVFNGDSLTANNGTYTDACPISTCCGSIFECDEEMLVPISILNEKGYITEYCCSGHIYDTSCGGYIKFVDGYEPKGSPQGWHIDTTNCIRYDWKRSDSPVDKLKIRHKRIENLIKWCETLEDCNDL